MLKPFISVQTDDFDQSVEYKRLCVDNDSQGAVVTFTGLVRDHNLGHAVTGLYLEHYPAMTEKALVEIAEMAQARWSIGRLSIIHRVGELSINQQIVFVGVTCEHRKAAFEACEFIMDYLKTQAPFWKKEHTSDISQKWVQARDSDLSARQKWTKTNPNDPD
ncbi:molybdopterin synthase catalytic subunit MoaE [Aliiglaciecola sp. LCG003]|uniref:molybdopterin synthase catalytic subunit MoaE n=1 Tax=Aliiglaciecola sp. LCG003 TaxID=3053655 RepID=UPI0025744F14|nr:molybdopterin synthase catalytic subunit MoaE [Aliiglaciecola sp. LCG003]WJG11130.1 molybdopterin synthase catalytic subunit MoaE [Aliiglaciecola sp. LCG003]